MRTPRSFTRRQNKEAKKSEVGLELEELLCRAAPPRLKAASKQKKQSLRPPRMARSLTLGRRQPGNDRHACPSYRNRRSHSGGLRQLFG
jgi:hypothetical protein